MGLKPDLDVCRSVLEGSGLAHFHIPNWARDLLPIARELGLVIACDIQDVISPRSQYRQAFVEHAHFLFFSAANHADPAPLIRSFLAIQPEQVIVVGLGAQGCALGTRERIEFFPPVEMNTPVVDTNGAGDGLAVGFLSSHILDGYSLHDSVLRGQIVARHTCAQKASTSHLIGPEQLDEAFRELAQDRS